MMMVMVMMMMTMMMMMVMTIVSVEQRPGWEEDVSTGTHGNNMISPANF